jgi:hypothetical protein
VSRRYAIRDRILTMDPVADREEIARLVATYEFPWDVTQALSFALFRTYAVPSIGALLARTAELTDRTQKRHDDTVLVLDAILTHGLGSGPGRAALRRMNQMHRSYDISNDDMRYVLATFVVTPVRWIDEFGWRRLTSVEIASQTAYYRELGRHMGIRDIPETYDDFADLLDAYEAEHVPRDGRPDAGGRAVADATMELFFTFPPNRYLPRPAVRLLVLSLMGRDLALAFGYRPAPPYVERLCRALVRLRGRAVRWLPPRRRPFHAHQLSYLRTYPDGYRVEELGTFPPGCPVDSER